MKRLKKKTSLNQAETILNGLKINQNVLVWTTDVKEILKNPEHPEVWGWLDGWRRTSNQYP